MTSDKTTIYQRILQNSPDTKSMTYQDLRNHYLQVLI